MADCTYRTLWEKVNGADYEDLHEPYTRIQYHPRGTEVVLENGWSIAKQCSVVITYIGPDSFQEIVYPEGGSEIYYSNDDIVHISDKHKITILEPSGYNRTNERIDGNITSLQRYIEINTADNQQIRENHSTTHGNETLHVESNTALLILREYFNRLTQSQQLDQATTYSLNLVENVIPKAHWALTFEELSDINAIIHTYPRYFEQIIADPDMNISANDFIAVTHLKATIYTYNDALLHIKLNIDFTAFACTFTQIANFLLKNEPLLSRKTQEKMIPSLRFNLSASLTQCKLFIFY